MICRKTMIYSSYQLLNIQLRFRSFFFVSTFTTYMPLPFFFIENLSGKNITLDEDTSRHIAGVLRMQIGGEILLTDGKGKTANAIITNDHRKKCEVEILHTKMHEQSKPFITVAISLIKNSSRFEWFLEKAAEINVNEIIPLICERTEKEKFRIDRMKNILVSAILQSQQSWLPELHAPIKFTDVIINARQEQKLIAHCVNVEKKQLTSSLNFHQSSIILIGPEGDFTEKEIQFAMKHGYQPVSMGTSRLRTETAGIVAATILRIK